MSEYHYSKSDTCVWEYHAHRKMGSLPWEVTLMRDGRKVGTQHTATRWGARYAARKMKRQRLRLDKATAQGKSRDRGTL